MVGALTLEQVFYYTVGAKFPSISNQQEKPMATVIFDTVLDLSPAPAQEEYTAAGSPGGDTTPRDALPATDRSHTAAVMDTDKMP